VPAVYHAVQLAFVDALHNTFLVSVVSCLVGAAVAALLRNPERAAVRDQTPLARRTGTLAD
jgi:hypothetical protein